jgi:hypothetical protein
MARFYNRHRRPTPVFRPGEKVYLDGSDIKTTRPSQKLSHRRLGPYEVVKAVGTHAYQLKLPRSLSQLHPVFPVIKLTPAPPDLIAGRCPKPPPPPVLVEGEQEWEVEEVMDSRLFRGKLQYLVRWKGYGIEEASWEPRTNVHAPQLTAKFHKEHPGAPRHIRRIYFEALPVRATSTDPPKITLRLW